MSTLREAAQQALETLEALSAAENIIWVQKRAEIEVEHLRAALAQEEQATGKDSFTVDWMKQALTVVWNFPSHPGFHPADSSADQDGEDPTSAWRAGWIAAVGAMQDAVRHMTPDPQEQAEQAQEPVAWGGHDLDAMVEAFSRVIEAHYQRANPFQNPIDMDAQMALRALRGFIPAMKAYTAPPQRPPLTVQDLQQALVDTGLIFPEAIDDAEGFDHGVTLERIDKLHLLLVEAGS